MLTTLIRKLKVDKLISIRKENSIKRSCQDPQKIGLSNEKKGKGKKTRD